MKFLPLFLMAGGLFGWCSLARAAGDDSGDAISVQQLIAQLGDEQYVLRQRAETQLLERGADAFVQLKAAENHADLEIATRAKYLLKQISIDWVRPIDSAVVRSIMARFGELSRLEKLNRVVKLSKLDHEQGFSALRRVAKYESSVLVARFAIYYLANAHTRQGNLEDAEKLSQRALQMEVPEVSERNLMASDLAELGRHDWAEREWRHIIDTEDITDVESLNARQLLGLFVLHDQLEYKAAADLLAETIDAIDGDPALTQQYRSDRNLGRRLNLLRSHREYYLAFHFQASDTEKQRQHLEQAYRLDSSNADVLIAMYHVKDSDDPYRKQTQLRIAKSLRQVEAQIKMAKNNPHWYNHWAWLVSNTEGDFAKAVQYSQRSLELEPGSPSYLDTLGRCYFSAGDLENAVKVEREAIVKHPHLQVMRRQLQEFEDALQKREEVQE